MATVTTKGDLVLVALRKAGLASNSSLTQPEPEMIDDALTDLELMVAEWENNDIRLGFVFSPIDVGPDTGDLHGLLPGDVNAVAYKLAERILTDTLRPIPPTLAADSRAAWQALLNRQIDYSAIRRKNSMPVGQGSNPCNWHGNYFQEPSPEDELTTQTGQVII